MRVRCTRRPPRRRSCSARPMKCWRASRRPPRGGSTVSKEAYDRGMKTRRKVLGDAWVDRAERSKTDFNADFQALITRYAWDEIWNRPGIEHRVRRMIVIAQMVALGRWEEFQLHVRAA